jgi:colicin import membrane protein
MDGARGEGLGDKLRAFALALGLHVACLLALLVGLWWTHETRPVVMPGPVIEATLVGPTAAPKAKPGASRPWPSRRPPTSAASRKNASARSRCCWRRKNNAS